MPHEWLVTLAIMFGVTAALFVAIAVATGVSFVAEWLWSLRPTR